MAGIAAAYRQAALIRTAAFATSTLAEAPHEVTHAARVLRGL